MKLIISGPFLLEIAAQVKKITIYHKGLKTFLGGVNVDWVELIADMFNKGANEIHFKNLSYPYISAEEHHRLIEVR